jgi:hypothetical protein
MENNFNLLNLPLIAIVLFATFNIMFGLMRINNKLYDIREHINGTCVLETTYNGICKANN